MTSHNLYISGPAPLPPQGPHIPTFNCRRASQTDDDFLLLSIVSFVLLSGAGVRSTD